MELTNRQIAVLNNRVAGSKTSSRYLQVTTQDVLDNLLIGGWQITSCKISRGDVTGRHEVRLTHPDIPNLYDAYGHTEGRGEIILVNSNDGKTSFRLMIGFWRQACSNGLVVGHVEDEFKFRHTLDKRELLTQIAAQANTFKDKILSYYFTIVSLKGKTLPVNFAEQAMKLRYTEPYLVTTVGDNFLGAARRKEDEGTDAWRTFNRIQEGLVAGGFKYVDDEGKVKTARRLGNLKLVADINKRLWEMTLAQAA